MLTVARLVILAFVASLLAAGSAAAEPRLHLAVTPTQATVNEVTRFTFVVTRGAGARRRPVARAVVSFRGARRWTDRHGRTSVVRRISQMGVFRARACKRGFRCASVRVILLGHG